MANIITAGNSTNGGTAISTDTSGTLNIVTGSGSGANAITIDASQNVAMTASQTIAGNLTVTGSITGGSISVANSLKAWVNFNGTGTPAIRASGNVSSITDNGTGNYTVNFTTAISDANYACTATGDGTTSSTHCWVYASTYTSSNVNLQMTNPAGTRVDPTVLSSSIFR